MPEIIDLNTFADGALLERANVELQKIFENIMDPNTDASKKRKLTLTITMEADDKRDIVFTNVVAKTTLAPAKRIESKFILDRDNKGKPTGAELKSGIKGQTYIDVDTSEIKDDRGAKVVNLKN